MERIISFDKLESCDLIKGTTYKGGLKNDLSSEPISKILKVGNQGGIRCRGSISNPKIVVLFTTFKDEDWPDSIIKDKIVYYGDNKEPGKEIHDTKGNKILRSIFETYHLSSKNNYPLILLFSKCEGFNRRLEGVLKPGYKGLDETEDLIAVWKTSNNKRFQNYKAYFTILPVKVIKRVEIDNV